MCDISQPSWPVVFTNEAWEAETGIKCRDDSPVNFWDVFQVGQICTVWGDLYDNTIHVC